MYITHNIFKIFEIYIFLFIKYQILIYTPLDLGEEREHKKRNDIISILTLKSKRTCPVILLKINKNV